MIPSTMKAIELQAYGQPLRLAERPVPQPGPKQVLVKIAAAPVNPSDLATLEEPSLGGRLPMIPGREGSGVVVAAGSEPLAQRLMGQRVACASGYGRDGTWAEYLVTHAANCFALHDEIDFETGAMAIVNPLTAWALLDLARRGGHQALANTAAASQLGRMMHRLGQSWGLAMVHIVRRAEQADLLKSLGAQHILIGGAPGFPARLKEVFTQVGVTLALDAVAGDMTRHLLNALPDRGELVVYGLLSGGECRFDAVTMVQSHQRISGFLLSNWMREQNDITTIADQVQQHLHAELKSEVRQRITLADVPAALAAYRQNMTAGKLLLVL